MKISKDFFHWHLRCRSLSFWSWINHWHIFYSFLVLSHIFPRPHLIRWLKVVWNKHFNIVFLCLRTFFFFHLLIALTRILFTLMYLRGSCYESCFKYWIVLCLYKIFFMLTLTLSKHFSFIFCFVFIILAIFKGAIRNFKTYNFFMTRWTC